MKPQRQSGKSLFWRDSLFQGRSRVIAGTFFHAPVCGAIETLTDTLIRIGEDGAILELIAPAAPEQAEIRRAAAADGTLELVGTGRYILPGFVDLHLHAP